MPLALLALAVAAFGIGTTEFVIMGVVFGAPILAIATANMPRKATLLGITLMLLLFGVGLTADSMLGGRLADSRLLPSLVGMALAVVLVLAAFTQTSHSLIPAAITLLLCGVFAFALCPILQLLIIDQAHEAPNLGSTLNQSAFNLGNGIGGLVVASGANLSDLPWTGALVSRLTVLTGLFFIYLQRRGTDKIAHAA